MKKFALLSSLVLNLLIVASPLTAWANGAVAFGACVPADRLWGISHDQSSAQSAASAALQYCHDPSCHVVMPFSGLCSAVALDKYDCGSYGAGSAPTIAYSQSRAIEGCQRSGGRNCVVVKSFCDGASAANGQGTPIRQQRCVPWVATPNNSNCGNSGHEACPHPQVTCQ